GMRTDRFTPDSNPSSTSDSSAVVVLVEEIRFENGVMMAHIETTPMRLDIIDLSTADTDGDGVVMVGEHSTVGFSVANLGGVTARDVRVVLRTSDPFLEVRTPEVTLGDLELGDKASGQSTVRFRSGFHGTHAAHVVQEVYAQGELVTQRPFTLTGISAVRAREVAVSDDLGNGDSRVQVAEIFQLLPDLEVSHPELPKMSL
ncbi:MAG: hypothetical protein HOC05_20535, partial [Gemmatimonadetes bacterium]|nr:hypothetical protein [Gemmatimonadota bacterium]